MFNFLLQGKVGEMMAPVQSQEAQLLIAIQNRQPDKVRPERESARQQRMDVGGKRRRFLVATYRPTLQARVSRRMPQRKLCVLVFPRQCWIVCVGG